MDHKCQNCYWYGLISIFELMFFRNNLLHLIVQDLNIKLPSCFEMFFKHHWFFSVQWNLEESEVRKSVLNVYMPGHSNSCLLCSTCYFFTSRSQPMVLYTWGGAFLSRYKKIDFFFGIQIMIGDKWQKS